jgi:isopentenyl-diphosphate delta-isomerase
VARPVLLAATRSEDELAGVIEQLMLELRTAMFLTGCADVEALKRSPYLLTGDTERWLAHRT